VFGLGLILLTVEYKSMNCLRKY